MTLDTVQCVLPIHDTHADRMLLTVHLESLHPFVFHVNIEMFCHVTSLEQNLYFKFLPLCYQQCDLTSIGLCGHNILLPLYTLCLDVILQSGFCEICIMYLIKIQFGPSEQTW
jgi:hypothetical protein